MKIKKDMKTFTFSLKGGETMLKLGLASAILPDYSFEQVIDTASSEGLSCVEMMCWPKGKALRRYAGVTHIDAETVTREELDRCLEYAASKGVAISSLGYYPNTMDADPEKRRVYISHIYKLIDLSHMMGVDMVTTFIGRNLSKNLEDNLEEMVEVWTPILKYASEKGVKIAIENCPMFYTKDEWPGGTNLACSPFVWRTMFERMPFDNFGLNYDPSHMLLQGTDYIRPVYEFKDRIFHTHIKDIKMYPDKIYEYGMFGYPSKFHSPKVPGLGDLDWGKFMSALYDIGYDGAVCIEIEDKAFESCQEDVLRSIHIGVSHISQFYCR